MSTFKQKKELKAQIAAAKAAGKSTQTIGRLQYKLNQLTASPKGNAVKTKSGSVVKTKSGGTVRTKPTSTVAKKRPVAKRKKPLVGHPSGGTAPAPARKVSTGPSTRPVNTNRVRVSAAPHPVITKGKARGIEGVGPNAARNKRIAELERLLKAEERARVKEARKNRTSAR
jgi:hypothetical protein